MGGRAELSKRLGKMIALRIYLLLLYSLLLITLFNGASGFDAAALHSRDHSHEKPHSYHNKTAERSHHPNRIPIDYKYKRQTLENPAYGSDSSLLLNTSCRQALCARSPYYPSSAISQAVDRVRKVLRSDDQLDLEEKQQIDPTVVEYFPILQHVIDNYYLPEPYGCDHYMNIFVPEEGNSVDEQTYYVVNSPSYRQRVASIVCTNAGDVCNNDFTQSTCHQNYREEQLLVLPFDTEFNISDFQVKKFKVPNGCACYELSRL